MTFLLIVTAALITYGLAFCVALTSGPFNAFGLLRKKIKESASSKTWVKEGISCPVCCSFWISIPVACLLAPDIATALQLWFTSLGVTCVITSLSPE